MTTKVMFYYNSVSLNATRCDLAHIHFSVYVCMSCTAQRWRGGGAGTFVPEPEFPSHGRLDLCVLRRNTFVFESENGSATFGTAVDGQVFGRFVVSPTFLNPNHVTPPHPHSFREVRGHHCSNAFFVEYVNVWSSFQAHNTKGSVSNNKQPDLDDTPVEFN